MFLLSPNSSDERIRFVADQSSGFVYLVSVLGITGERAALPVELAVFEGEVKEQLDIVLQQAFRNVLPILLTQTIILFQDTSLVFVVGLADFMTSAVNVAQRDSRLIELYIFAAFVYFVMCYFGSLYVKHLQNKMHR